MAVRWALDNVSISISPFAASDTVTVKYRVRNTGTVTISSFSTAIRHNDGRTPEILNPFPKICDAGGRSTSLAAGKSATITETIDLSEAVSAETIASLFGGGARAIPAVLFVVVADSTGGLDFKYMSIGSMLNARLAPTILNFSTVRCDASGVVKDEGLYAYAFIRTQKNPDPTGYRSSFARRVHYAQGRAATLEDPYITITSVANPYSQTLSSTVEFSVAHDYGLLLYYGDEYEYVTMAGTLFRPVVNVHLSGTGKGVAFGKFSASTEYDQDVPGSGPLFECVYPAIFSCDVISPPGKLLKVVQVTGTVSMSSGSTTATKTLAVTAGTGWTPIGVVGFKASQSWCSVREAMLVNGEVEMSLRYHGSSSSSQTVTLTADVLCLHTAIQ